MAKSKNLSNPFSTGGGGFHFESHIQASFVALMLTGGYAPCLPCWPITEIKLQNKIDGFNTDDIIVIVEDANSKEKRKLVGQIKHSISITQGDAMFGEIMQSAWDDFNNAGVFEKDKDVIALITGPLSKTDGNVKWLLEQARCTKNMDELFRHVEQPHFCSNERREKLKVIQHHLKVANGDKDVLDSELYEFLRHFHLFGYDLGDEGGVVQSLMYSYISKFQPQYPEGVWARIINIVQIRNQNAGTITRKNLPRDLSEVFKTKDEGVNEHKQNKDVQDNPKIDKMQHDDATCLALVVLIGAWQDDSQYDRNVIAQLLGVSYDEWLKKAQEILLYPNSPLSLKNGTWKVINKSELWKQLGARIFDRHIDTFKLLALSVLKEADPAFEIPAEERYMASIYGKEMKHSRVLREGIAEGLAILGTQPDACINCKRKVEVTCRQVIYKLLSDADYALWGSLNRLLPTLAEVAPDEFLNRVDKAMCMNPCPFNELFSQEGNGITGGNYLTGLLWALEGIAWEEQKLVSVCVVLGKLASHDPGGQWANRPANSLATILMPWLPQTLALVEKRKAAVQIILNKCTDIVAWNLLLQLLPSQNQFSVGTHKPIWRKLIPDDWKEGVTIDEYQQQISFYVELAVDKAGQDIDKLSKLINYFDSLPESDFNKILSSLASQSVIELPEEQRVSIWEHLMKFTKKHRRYPDTQWALPSDIITRIEQVAEQLVPKNPFNLYQHLFSDRDLEFNDNDNLNEQEEKFNTKRENAISEIFQQNGVEGVIQFAETVYSPRHVGQALSVITDTVIERTFLPHFLATTNDKHKALVRDFIWTNHFKKGWEWSDNIDKSVWTSSQIGQFLAYLPFTNEAWERASKWLQREESEYWSRANAHAYNHDDSDFSVAIDKLIDNNRPRAAINCLNGRRSSNQPIDTGQCIRALRASLSLRDTIHHTMSEYSIVELIKLLQTSPLVNQDDLCQVELGYLASLEHYGITPQTLESRLANDPKFFCEIIQLIYRSKKEESPYREATEESKAIATHAYQLLHRWKISPGTQKDGTFSEKSFIEWLQSVKATCIESGHLDVALTSIGEVLIDAPPDPNGLWIHRAFAKELDSQENDNMREGFRTGVYNSRGFHFVDPTGAPERKLAKQFRDKAEEVENAGFNQFANTLRDLANGYDKEAERIIDEEKDSN